MVLVGPAPSAPLVLDLHTMKLKHLTGGTIRNYRNYNRINVLQRVNPYIMIALVSPSHPFLPTGNTNTMKARQRHAAFKPEG